MEEIVRAEHPNNFCTNIYIDARNIDFMLTVISRIRITAYSNDMGCKLNQIIEFKYSLYCDDFNGDDADEEEYESGHLTIEEFNNRLKEYISLSLADSYVCLHDLDYFNMLKEIANIGDKI